MSFCAGGLRRFGGLALALNILWRKKRGTVLNFDSFLQDRRIVLILPVRNRPRKRFRSSGSCAAAWPECFVITGRT